MDDDKEDRRARQRALNDDPELDPYEIEFLPEFREGRGERAPFVNEHGVIIGDHDYESSNSPLTQWSVETDPAIMAGEQWVHPFKDVGFLTAENRDYFEQRIAPQAGIFMHLDKNAAYGAGEPDKSADKAKIKQPE
ncbi:DUF3905 domain-containing protein [Paenibacillus harenae]|uniref:DUF3905 domain-containing protein n=1 Tax=Paenibacillus harenae TaxID=306543 RepID=A0ABT9TYR1_PAEHA|nr:DUF3905 domain-containing protein [Paenibacillus harenae]MDQ0060454.1 hypothetical protein [Paenibacillus harenae]MDQ0112031.1 hypothetical protein [Paenibacillus harenae]